MTTRQSKKEKLTNASGIAILIARAKTTALATALTIGVIPVILRLELWYLKR